MSGTAARTGMPVQVKAVFTVLKRLSKRNRLRKLTTVLMMNVFSVRFKIKKIWFALKGYLHYLVCLLTNIDYFSQQGGQINFCKRG